MCWAVWRQHHLDADEPAAAADPSERPATVGPAPISAMADASPSIAAMAADVYCSMPITVEER